MSFKKIGLEDVLLKALQSQGYSEPTPIQKSTIRHVIDGKDILASAQTGTGKTAAFILPLLQNLLGKQSQSTNPKALIVTPTRELASQVLESTKTYGRYTKLRSMAVFGGVKIGQQIKNLQDGMDIVVATPGRLLDLHQQRAINLNDIQTLVLDEADRMLDMGFIRDITRIQKLTPQNKQILMFSATYSREIRKLAAEMLNNPIRVDVAEENKTAEKVDQCVIPIDKHRKPEALVQIFEYTNFSQSLVFTRTKHGANKLAKFLTKSGIEAKAIHSDRSQANRTRVLEGFKRGKVAVLVATDIASRGLDIDELPLVINYELPHVAEDYVHRIGRTGRAGKEGAAYSLVSADESKQLFAIEKLTRSKIEREMIEGLEPQVPLAEPTYKRQEQHSAGKRRNGKRRSKGQRRHRRAA